MAHNIKKYDRQEGTKMGWHNLTQVREVITTKANWLREWDIVPVTLDKKGQPTKYRVLEASDVPGLEIGSAYNSETFEPISNLDFLRMVEDCLGGTDHKIVSVGSVRNRGRVFLSVELANVEKFCAAGRDFSAFLNFGNGHDKSSVWFVNTSNTCTVCDNTYTINLFTSEQDRAGRRNDIRATLRHYPGAIKKFPELAALVDKAVGVQAEFAVTLEGLANTPVKVDTARELFAGFLGRELAPSATELTDLAEKRTNRLVDLFQTGRGNNGENLADAFSAVTDFYTHESVRGGDQERQFLSSEYEHGARAKREFLNILTTPERFSETVTRGNQLLAVAQ
jgi:Domain of unknown function (DUF932)